MRWLPNSGVHTLVPAQTPIESSRACACRTPRRCRLKIRQPCATGSRVAHELRQLLGAPKITFDPRHGRQQRARVVTRHLPLTNG